ncbi:MAG: hypothetical protein EHM89_15885 [Acidobacteria bacterium]|nr:MAG: hypothetical protein EHM89_15885 [Acidobacteriota bacterium]
MRIRLVGGVVLALCPGVMAAQAQSLADMVRRHGPIELALIRDGGPVELHELVKASEIIARGRVVGLKSFESRQGSSAVIVTDYVVDVLDILHQQLVPLRQAGDQIVVRRDGGELTVENVTVRAYVPDFPAWEIGEEYVLALREDPKTKTFAVMYDGQGAFRIGSDWVARQVRHIQGETPEERTRVDLPVDELRSLIVTLGAQP